MVWLVLDRPGRLNAMTDQMRREILDVLDRVHSGDWRVLAIRGEGRAFCSGADLEQILVDVDVTDAPAVRQFMLDGWQAVVERMRRCRVPIVAAVHGAAYGGGANLALAADLVVAAESAVFCQAYVDRGITPDLGASWVLPRLVGLQQARRMLLLGDRVSAVEAVQLGLVAEVTPDDRLLSRTAEIAAALAAKSPESVAIIRDLVDRNSTNDLTTALAAEADAVAVTLGGAGFRESLAAFAARRRLRRLIEKGLSTTMDFTLTEEQEAFRDTMRDWVDKECPKQYANELEQKEFEYPFELWDKMTAAGLARHRHLRGVWRPGRRRLDPDDAGARARPLAGRPQLGVGHLLLRRRQVGRLLRHRRAEGPVPARPGRGKAAVRHRLHRTGRRHRSARRDEDPSDQGGRWLGASTARRSGRPPPTSPTTSCCWRAPNMTSRSDTRA